MQIPSDLRLFFHPDYPEWVTVLSWLLMALFLLLSFAIMLGRTESESDFLDRY
ncbi:hypothetical protein HRE53_28980 (plasmid) [Acaryochloris sp. 'Moss Beach']|uniref:hypothetical protein n=1 Tax=Acaryochloris TaxID=155977 RepID=UPI001BB0B959|nr:MULTISPECIES: hypothetical protein [Acaryochloris]QUY46053.1 hypothetical protein I1H34_30540 [Acaryochloris marina S15]UJB72610.1 hypothetical protein HRE53_28980 [Acaryochloris sp. 'Moss Beach']